VVLQQEVQEAREAQLYAEEEWRRLEKARQDSERSQQK
jgi:hypothetical protein